MAVGKNSQEIIAQMKKEASSIITNRMVEAAAQKAGEKAIQLIRERTARGIDLNGKRFGGYNYSYQRFKTAFIKGSKPSKGKKKKETSPYIKKLLSQSTSYKATKVKDFLRLTGSLMSDLNYTVRIANSRTTQVTARIIIGVADTKNKKKVLGLQSTTGRNKYTSYAKKAFLFLGLSKSGAYKQKEEKEIADIFKKELQKLSQINIKTK